MKILIIKTGALGDVLRATTLLNILKGEIYWVTNPNAFDLLKNNNNIKIIDINNTKEIENINFDLTLSLDEEDTPAKLASKVKTKKLIGVYFKNNIKTYTKDSSSWFDLGIISKFGKEKADQLKKQNKKSYQDLYYQMFNKEFKEEAYILNLNNHQKQLANKFIEENNLQNKEIIGINLGSGSRWKLKKYPITSTIKLIKLLQKQNKIPILFGGPEEKERNKIIKEETNILSPETIEIEKFIALISICNKFITTDSLGMHIAIALKIPTIALFGPTSPQEVYHYNILKKIAPPLDCIVCYKKENCNIHPNCLELISPKKIIKELEK